MYETAELVEEADEAVEAPRSAPSVSTLLGRIIERLKRYW